MSEIAEDLVRWLPDARAGSREALGQAFEAYRAYLLLIANRQLDPELCAKGGASDLVQETFLEAQRDFSQFTGGSGNELQAWLRQLLLNNLANFVRHYRGTEKRQIAREVEINNGTTSGMGNREIAAETPSPSGEVIAQERIELLETVLQCLPEDYSNVINWRYREGRSFEEIATLMQRSENAVRKLWFRAIEKLHHEVNSR